MSIPHHAKFIARTVFVKDGNVERALNKVNRIMTAEGFFKQFRLTRYYEKPTYMRQRINFERAKSIYMEEMQRKIKFLMRKNRVDPYPGAS